MRSIEHPGPVHAERVQSIPTAVRQVEIELPRGESLLDSLSAAVAAHGATSAVFSLHGGSLAPMAFFMPAESKSPDHAVYFSDRFEAIGAAHLESGCITFGRRDGQPWLHCHAVWTESDGQRRCGHISPAESKIAEPIRLSAWLIAGADFIVSADAETNFSLFQPAVIPNHNLDINALVVRVRPNEDLCTSLESACMAHGIRNAEVRGGVVSLVGAAFNDGRTVEPFVTEVFIHKGLIAPGPDGALRAHVDVSLVDHTGQMAEGRLRRGQNPVLVTFEIVLEATGSEA
jgi:predicted DNA-binding protein with PD1-like motif